MPIRSVLVRKPFNKKRAIPRMSWAPENLYNIWLRTSQDSPIRSDLNFTRSSLTLFQQRWRSKRLTKGYHGDFIGQSIFGRWYLPSSLPSIRQAGQGSSKSTALAGLAAWTEGRKERGRDGERDGADRRVRDMERDGRSPVGTMMFREVERRVDVLVFRACFAASVWQARGYVVQGHVKVNGELVRNPNHLLEPGDIFTVDPAVIPFIRPPASPSASIEAVESEESADSEAAVAEAAAEAAVTETTGSESESAELSPHAAAEETVTAPAETPSASSSSAPTATTTSADGTPATHFTLPPYASPHIFVPPYLLPSYLTCSAVYVRHPTARPGYSEIPSPFDADGSLMSLSWEWFSRMAPRMRDKRKARLMDPQRSTDRK